jgi:energy-converting hydrogenase Eha subunit A
VVADLTAGGSRKKVAASDIISRISRKIEEAKCFQSLGLREIESHLPQRKSFEVGAPGWTPQLPTGTTVHALAICKQIGGLAGRSVAGNL